MNICPKANVCCWKSECPNAQYHKHIKGQCREVQVRPFIRCSICADEAKIKAIKE